MKITNKANLPDAIVRAITNDPYNAGRSDISVTRLIDSPQIVALAKKHYTEIEEDASDRIWALLGQAVHVILERAESVAVAEGRLTVEIEGWKVSGGFDRMAVIETLLQDYKVTSVWAVKDGVKREWERQLNCLRYLAWMHGHKIEKLQIVAILRDWSIAKAFEDPNYPQQQVKVIDVPTWDLSVTEEYMRARVRLHQAAQSGEPLECTEDERWERATWAIKKPEAKRATKANIETEAEAQQMAAEKPGLIVEKRGEAIRCKFYCSVNKFCRQYNQQAQEAVTA
jgi:histone H3/H4